MSSLCNFSSALTLILIILVKIIYAWLGLINLADEVSIQIRFSWLSYSVGLHHTEKRKIQLQRIKAK